MTEQYKIGDHVQIFLGAKNWKNEGWFKGVIIRIDPYSEHRKFYWVELDADLQALIGAKQISVLNPKNIRHSDTIV